MLTLLADQPECLWDDALPVEVSHERVALGRRRQEKGSGEGHGEQ